MKLSQVEAFFNAELPDQLPGAPGPKVAYVNVRYMGAGKWSAQLHNIYYENRGQQEPVIGNGSDGEAAVAAMISLMQSAGTIFRLGCALNQRGTELVVDFEPANDRYQNPAA